MNRLVLGLLGVVVVGSACADIYKWVDSNGTVHFTDSPHKGARPVELGPMQTYTPPPPPPPPAPGTKLPADNNGTHAYKSVSISQPADQATIRNNNGYVPVLVETNPELQQGDGLQLIYDGNPLGKPQVAKVFMLNEVYRGTHTVAVQIVDADGKEILTSDQVTFFMHRPRVGMGG